MSFLNVFSEMFGTLFSNPIALFAIFAMVGVLVGYGIYQLGCYLSWW